jgi:O-antigen/teichoic acid export membrane protein
MARGGTFNLVAVAWMGLASFALVVVLTRGLGPAGYGLIATAIAVFTLLSNVGELGADTGLLREIPRLLVLKRARDTRAVLRVSLYPVLLVGVVIAALVYIYAPQLTHVLVRHNTTGNEVNYLRVLTPFLAIAPAATVALAGTRGFGNLRIFALVQNIFVPTVRPIAAVAVLVAGLGGLAVMLSWGAPLVVALVAALVYLLRFTRRAEAGPAGLEEPRPTRVVAREFWSFTAARGVAGALAIAVTQVNLLLVSGLRSAHDAGVFSAVMRYVIMGTFAFQAMRVAIGPQISRLLAERRERDAETVFQTATWWLMALSWPFYLLLAVFASTVLSLFGHGFTTGATALAILAVAELVDMGTGNVTLVLLMGGRSQWNLINISLGLVTTVGLGFLLIPHYGVVGAAIAWAATIVIENGAAAVQVGVLMKMKPFGSGYWYVALAAAGCFLGLGVLARLIGLSGPVALAATVVVGGPLYLAVLHRFRTRLRLDLLAQTLLRRGSQPARTEAVR